MPVPRSTLMLAVTEILSGKKMFNRGNLNNENINGDSREMWTKETIYFAVGKFFDAHFLHQVDIYRFCIWKQTELTFCFKTILNVLFLYFPKCFLFVL